MMNTILTFDRQGFYLLSPSKLSSYPKSEYFVLTNIDLLRYLNSRTRQHIR